jgi:hypothetical protein
LHKQFTVLCGFDSVLAQPLYELRFVQLRVPKFGPINCIAARSMSMDLQTDATIAEAYATIRALIFCKELGHTNIILEGDAMNVIKSIEAEGPCLSNYGHLIECIKRELQQLENANFIHVLRDANNAAHTLAKLATTHVTMSTWLGDVPPSIGDIVRQDKSLLLV